MLKRLTIIKFVIYHLRTLNIGIPHEFFVILANFKLCSAYIVDAWNVSKDKLKYILQHAQLNGCKTILYRRIS